jgi:DNA mismatch endonuclease (patch repair protein)
MVVMADNHTPEQRSYNMSRIRSTNTQLELMFFKLLEDGGIKYDAHPKMFGKPDCMVRPNILIFVDSDFWHGWHFYQWRDRLPQEYWVEKIERNMKRDSRKFKILRNQGYTVLRIWEHSLKRHPERVLGRIQTVLEASHDGNL